jgi:hypothetical protein
MLMGYALVATFASVFVIAMLGIALRIRFVYRMKTYHREQWLKIGSPSLLGNRGISEVSMLRYLRRKEYLSLNDPKTVRSARDLHAVGIAILVCICIGSATIFGIILYGKFISHE